MRAPVRVSTGGGGDGGWCIVSTVRQGPTPACGWTRRRHLADGTPRRRRAVHSFPRRPRFLRSRRRVLLARVRSAEHPCPLVRRRVRSFRSRHCRRRRRLPTIHENEQWLAGGGGCGGARWRDRRVVVVVSVTAVRRPPRHNVAGDRRPRWSVGTYAFPRDFPPSCPPRRRSTRAARPAPPLRRAVFRVVVFRVLVATAAAATAKEGLGKSRIVWNIVLTLYQLYPAGFRLGLLGIYLFGFLSQIFVLECF